MMLPKEFSRFDLVGPTAPKFRRLVCTGEGGPGTGKTDFFYRTFPRPALVIQLDLNDEGLRERYVGKDLFFKDVIVPPFVKHTEEVREQDMVIATMVRDLYAEVFKKPYFRSVMIDEGSALYTLGRRAFLVGLGFGESKESDYSGVNAWMARFFTLAKQHRINLYIPHRQREERKDSFSKSGVKTSVRTGEKVAEGWKNSLYESQCHVVFTKDEKLKTKDPLEKFDMQITKCTANTKAEGFIFNGSDITLANLGQVVFPLSDESNWV